MSEAPSKPLLDKPKRRRGDIFVEAAKPYDPFAPKRLLFLAIVVVAVTIPTTLVVWSAGRSQQRAKALLVAERQALIDRVAADVASRPLPKGIEAFRWTPIAAAQPQVPTAPSIRFLVNPDEKLAAFVWWESLIPRDRPPDLTGYISRETIPQMIYDPTNGVFSKGLVFSMQEYSHPLAGS